MVLVSVYSENPETMRLLSKSIADYMTQNKTPCRIYPIRTFAGAMSTEFAALRKSDYCLIDFAEPKNALSLAVKIMEEIPLLAWICVNASQQLFLDMLVLRPCGYIPSASDPERCHKELQRMDSFYKRMEQKRFFTFRYEGEYKRIPYKDISYFESSAKKVTLVQQNATTKYYFTAKLEDIQAQVPTFFLRCHQSFLVNMNSIRFFDMKNKLIIALPNDEVLVSRRLFTEAKRTYEAYIETQA